VIAVISRHLPRTLTLLRVIAWLFSGVSGIFPDTKTHRFHLAARCALGFGVSLAIKTPVLVRKLPKQQTTVHKRS